MEFRLGVLLIAAWGAAFAGEIDFDHDIVPILRARCVECHSGDKRKGGFSMNVRSDLMRGGEHGAVVVAGKSAESKLIAAVLSKDDDVRMPPPDGGREPLNAADVAKLNAWIDGGAVWTDGFAFKKASYEPPLRPRKIELPPAENGVTNPIDRILGAAMAKNKTSATPRLDDGAFMRKASLDLVGLLPEPESLRKFVSDAAPDKRTKLIQALLADNVAYAEHWLAFWNDLLRNDYAGTGYIDGGRKQISAWLYKSLLENKPYDVFARELLAPVPESEGFAKGIKWRGNVSAGQTVPVQFAQSVGQTFLGINLKCASCHDSFIDRWKLDEAYGLAAIFSPDPIEIHRCDKPQGRKAQAAWLFPELGQVDATKPPAERLKQLAALMTNPENGRFARTMVNRLWHRTMGRGIVHPLDAMQTEPWSADLLDFLASDFAEHKYDLKHTLELICTSNAYQSAAEILKPGVDDRGYVYAGPRTKRLTAEQFTDAIWQMTETAPAKFDAPVKRGRTKVELAQVPPVALSGQWIWSSDGKVPPPAGEAITLRKKFDLASVPELAGAVTSCDNEFTLYVNGAKIAESADWKTPVNVEFSGNLKKGANEILVAAKNGGTTPNSAGFFFDAHIKVGGKEQVLASDASWEWTKAKLNAKGAFGKPAPEFKAAVQVANQQGWEKIAEPMKSALAIEMAVTKRMVRASLMKSDLLMRTLGRPNREQIVSMRPTDLTTLEAMDLINGQILNSRLEIGAQNILKRQWKSNDELVRWIYEFALSRAPSASEMETAREALGAKASVQSVQDLLWAVAMLPEFQMVR